MANDDSRPGPGVPEKRKTKPKPRRKNLPPDPGEPGGALVWRFKHMMDDFVDHEAGGSEKKAAAMLGLDRGRLYSYRIPTREGPSLATLGRIAAKRRRVATRLLIAPEGPAGASEAAFLPARFLDLNPDQIARLAALVGAWDDAGVTDDALRIAEQMTRHLLPVPEKEN